MLNTCKNTEIPPKPSKKAVNIKFIDSFLQGIEEMVLIPFVISKRPVNNPCAKLMSILKKEKTGLIKIVKTLRIPLVLNIDIILENSTTNPPITRSVDILFIILSDKISPKLNKVTNFELEFLLEFIVRTSVFKSIFQNLKIIPTVTHDNKCVINNKIPIVVFLNINIPTVPIINRGPELFVKLNNLSHSSLEQIFFSLKLVAILAPTGYPLIIPIIKAKEPSPLILNNGFIIGVRKKLNIFIILVCIRSSVDTKNGKRDGTTEVAQSASPDFTAIKLFFEKNKIHRVNIRNKMAEKFFFNVIT